MRQIGVEEKRFSEAAKKSLNSTLTKSAVELKEDKVKEWFKLIANTYVL